jgi:hypothetical protein
LLIIQHYYGVLPPQQRNLKTSINPQRLTSGDKGLLFGGGLAPFGVKLLNKLDDVEITSCGFFPGSFPC